MATTSIIDSKSSAVSGSFTEFMTSAPFIVIMLSARGRMLKLATPDMLADEFYKLKNFDIIYDGIWPANNL